ncbi:MAG: hypothetical protein QOF83_93 [Solirubrobacteraceae bacterium]|jgi:hypothetical protein|nr:hypothetical protein [Solirubrobacteraceae bacterium]
MSDLLAIFTATDQDHDHELLDEIAAYRPHRITVLVEGRDTELVCADSSAGKALRDRLAQLMATIESQTGATVLGLAGDRSQLIGWRFDRELDARAPVAA